MTTYLRIHVDRIEGDLMHGHTDDLPEVAVALATPDGRTSHQYFASLAKHGSQVNIVDYKVIDGVHYPQLIVLEPHAPHQSAKAHGTYRSHTLG